MRFSVKAVLAALAAMAVAAPAEPLTNWLMPPPTNKTMPLLRIMPLGASITYGSHSPDGNGYRKGLRDALRYDGFQVNMVGSQAAGNMSDNQNAGFPGYLVDQVTAEAQNNIPLYKPNVVLINAGTNDALQDYAIATVGDRMEAMLAYIWSVVPDTVIALSTVLTQKARPDNVEVANAQYRFLAARLRATGKKIVLAEMDDGWITVDQLVDGVHPNEGGYLKMAERFYEAVRTAHKNCWIGPPVAVAASDATCDDGPVVDPHLPTPPVSYYCGN